MYSFPHRPKSSMVYFVKPRAYRFDPSIYGSCVGWIGKESPNINEYKFIDSFTELITNTDCTPYWTAKGVWVPDVLHGFAGFVAGAYTTYTGPPVGPVGLNPWTITFVGMNCTRYTDVYNTYTAVMSWGVGTTSAYGQRGGMGFNDQRRIAGDFGHYWNDVARQAVYVSDRVPLVMTFVQYDGKYVKVFLNGAYTITINTIATNFVIDSPTWYFMGTNSSQTNLNNGSIVHFEDIMHNEALSDSAIVEMHEELKAVYGF